MQNLDQLDGTLPYPAFVAAARRLLDEPAEFVFLEWDEQAADRPTDEQAAALARVRDLMAQVQEELGVLAATSADPDYVVAPRSEWPTDRLVAESRVSMARMRAASHARSAAVRSK